jgi:uncharacterized membrane protein SpoIIM required for sporulation
MSTESFIMLFLFLIWLMLFCIWAYVRWIYLRIEYGDDRPGNPWPHKRLP